MAYNRDDHRNRRYERDRDFGREPYGRDQFRGGSERGWDRGEPRDERGFFERAGDEIASWFGDEPEHRRHREHRDERGRSGSSLDRVYGGSSFERGQRGRFDRPEMGREGYFGASGFLGGTEEFNEPRAFGRGGTEPRGRQDYDPHYHSWRQRQIDELDRDYDEYRRENQSRFEREFGSWREQRRAKRQMLGQVREHMHVVGRDEEPVGTVDRVAGDRIILAKNDPEAGGVHHSLSCSDIDRIEGERVILDCDAAEAKNRWRDENRSRALFEREDQGEMGPRMLDRSFEGTYR